VPLSYEPGLWGIVFPVGMYGVASHELGAVLGLRWLVTLGHDEAWLALGVWAAVFLAMAGALLRFPRRQESGANRPGRCLSRGQVPGAPLDHPEPPDSRRLHPRALESSPTKSIGNI
jgi:Voltage-dependent anion channel